MTDRPAPTAPAGPPPGRRWRACRAWRRAGQGGTAVPALPTFQAMPLPAGALRPSQIVRAAAALLIGTVRSIRRHIRHPSPRLSP